MKKIFPYIFFAIIIHFMAFPAGAVEFNIKGQWIMSFGYGANGNFMGGYNHHHTIGWGEGQDNFEPAQKITIQMDAIVSSNLSGRLLFVMGDTYWGQASTGGALGTDARIIEVESAFIDWKSPNSRLKVRMGLQNITLPAFASNNSVMNGNTAAITASNQFTDSLYFTAFWARPYNDNYAGYNDAVHGGWRHFQKSFLDNIDAFGFLLPLSLENLSVTPWAMYAMLGPNTFRNGDERFPFGNLNANLSGDSSHYMAGMFPAGGARHRNFKNANSARNVSTYGEAFWAGLTARGVKNHFAAAFDLEYGSVNWQDDGRLRREGWFATLLLECPLNWGVPGLYGWYGSGDDANPANGSERMPALDPNNSNNYSWFAYDGAPYIERNGVIGNNMAGTWGIGARIKNMSFFSGFEQILRINYIRGTNSPKMAKKMSLAGLWTNGTILTPNYMGEGAELGHDSMYLTRLDSALELGTTISWRMYENLRINLEADYVFLFLNTGASAWGARHRYNQTIPSTKDAWNINLTFAFNF